MQEQSSGPRLIHTGAEETSKPEELDGQDITILKTIPATVRDEMGSPRATAKWIVRRADDTYGCYWAAGAGPTADVDLWFQHNPGLPLACRVFRQTNNRGTKVWHIEQRMNAQNTDGQQQESLDVQLAQAGLLG